MRREIGRFCDVKLKIDVMKEKILKGLKETYSNLGLSEEVLSGYAELVAGSVAEDADDAKVSEVVKNAEGYLKSIQGFKDRSVTDALKGKDKGEPKKEPEGDPSPEMKRILDLLEAQTKQNQEMVNRISELEGKSKQTTHDELVGRIASELNLSGDALDLAKAKLSIGMSEKEIRDSLGATKQTLIKLGMSTEGNPQVIVQEEEAARKEAEDWVKAQQAQQN